MAGPTDHGGTWIRLPDGDAIRDGIGLILAILRGDEEGQKVILENADLQSVAHFLAAGAGAMLAVNAGADPDAPPSALTEEQLQAVEAMLIAGIEIRSGNDPEDP